MAKAITIPNDIYRRTFVPDTVEIAGIVKVTYTETGSCNTDVDRLRQDGEPGNHMDTVHTLRNDYAADLVALYGNYEYSLAGCGYHYSDAAHGFSLVDYQAADYQYSASHEIGHNFGGHHDTVSYSSNWPYAYCHGFFATYMGEDWGTVMSYYGVGDRQMFYSDPDSVFQGVYRGTAARCDVARVHEVRDGTVAGFRTPQADVTIANRTLRSHEFGDVLATNTITANASDTLKDTSELWLRATNTVTLSTRFIVDDNAKLLIRTGSGALAKRARPADTQWTADRAGAPQSRAGNAVTQLSVCARPTRAGIHVEYAVPSAGAVRVTLHDSQGRILVIRDAEHQRAGRYQRTIPLDAGTGARVYFVRIDSGKRRAVSKAVPLR